jgi:hypothetical protein
MRDMKTAPLDGTRIIIWDEEDGLPHCAHWDGGDWYLFTTTDGDDDDLFIFRPMGWVPLPDEARKED